MKNLIEWTRQHALKSIGFAVLLTVIVTWTAMRDDLFWQGLTAFAIVTLIVATVVKCTSKSKVITLVLVASLACGNINIGAQESEPPTAEVGQAGCVVVVIVVGGIVIYSLVKFCQRHFPPPPPPATNGFTRVTLNAGEGEGGSSAGSYNYSSCGSCSTPTVRGLNLLSSNTPTTFELIGTVEMTPDGPMPVITSAALALVQTNTLLWADFQSAVQSHGIRVHEYGQGEVYYGLNGQPTDAEYVPIKFSTYDRSVSVTNANPTGTIIVERSVDMVAWAPVLNTKLSAGYSFRVVDTSLSGQAFYRTRLEPTPIVP